MTDAGEQVGTVAVGAIVIETVAGAELPPAFWAPYVKESEPVYPAVGVYATVSAV